ncbi:hypothetical protein EXM36_17070 [Clostridium botulinum]|nr:hypothetical protein [Clostridium botulinum]NFA13569.1 hypothetical protein [Clostridium botulinum]NFA19691.1 hypothetical protein [Clostridium botulinum]NFA39628.1 hypothetical protein [Clostridium botulinum]NFA55820.1 hypothetical protein [Clostridium botulinum]
MFTNKNKLFEEIKNTKIYQKYKPTYYEIDWGDTRAQGKRVGGMVLGAMSSGPKGVQTYTNLLGNIPEYKTNKKSFISLRDEHRQIWYLKAREYGLNHKQALIYAVASDGKYNLSDSKILKLLNENGD